MLKTLLKKNLTQIFRGYFYDAKKNRARSKLSIVLYFVFFAVIMVGVLGGMFTFLSLSICRPLEEAGMGWLYFALMGLLSVIFGTFGSVFNTFSGLYLAKDNDLLLSMPIPVSAIMISRLLMVYIMGVMYSGVILIPAIVVYWITVSPGALVMLSSVIFGLLISIFILSISCALGYVIARISLKLRHKSFITVIASLAFLGAYYFFYFKAQTVIQDLILNAAMYGTRIQGNAYPVYLFGRAAVGDGIALLIVGGVVVVFFAVVWWMISRSFIRIVTSSGHQVKTVYRQKAVKTKSAFGALLAKEFARFTQSSTYMLNCGLGILMMPVGGVMLLIKGDMIVEIFGEVFGRGSGSTPMILCGMVCLLASMNNMAAPSVSLEGKSLWLTQSIPVKPGKVLEAKIDLQLILTGVPMLFCLVCLGIVYPYTLGEILVTAGLMAAYLVFQALFDMFLGLKMPNVSWTSEVTPIKQSACAVISLFGGFGYIALVMVGFFLAGGVKLGFIPYASIVAGVTVVISLILRMWIYTRGCRIFSTL